MKPEREACKLACKHCGSISWDSAEEIKRGGLEAGHAEGGPIDEQHGGRRCRCVQMRMMTSLARQRAGNTEATVLCEEYPLFHTGPCWRQWRASGKTSHLRLRERKINKRKKGREGIWRGLVATHSLARVPQKEKGSNTETNGSRGDCTRLAGRGPSVCDMFVLSVHVCETGYLAF